MNPGHPRTAEHSPLAEAIFVALEAMETVCPKAERGPRLPGVGFDDLYRFATDPAMAMSRELRLALANDPRMRADLRRLVEQTSAGGGLFAAAASSGTVTTRHGTSFRMTLRESHADRSQVYVVIHLAGKTTAPPRALFVIKDNAACQKVPLPSPFNGTVQLLLEAGSDIVTALRDPATEVFVQ